MTEKTPPADLERDPVLSRILDYYREYKVLLRKR